MFSRFTIFLFVIISLLINNSVFCQPTSDQLNMLKSLKLSPEDMLSLKNEFKANNTINTESRHSNIDTPKATFTYTQDKVEAVKPKAPVMAEKNNSSIATSAIYGKNYFIKSNINDFDKSILSKAPDNYILGEGDEVNISIWGYSEFNDVLRIDQDGFIYPQNVGRIYIKGLSYKEAREIVQKKFSSVYDLSNSTFAFRLNYSREIKVNIVGEVNNPGTYAIQSINSAFNALSIANGPNELGSVRNIYIRRNGVTIKTLDVYDFLNNPDSKQDFFLQDNDYIVVPAATKIVTIKGEIRRPMQYELKSTENMAQALKLAGGLSAAAFTNSIAIRRFTNGNMSIINLNMNELASQNYELKDGDEITVNKLGVDLYKYISIEGAVAVPTSYEFKNGITLADIIVQAGGLTSNAFTSQAYINRLLPNYSKQLININLDSAISFPSSRSNILLKAGDVITIYSKTDFLDNIFVNVYGLVHKPGSLNYGTNMTLQDAIIQCGGFAIGAAKGRIEIARISNSTDNKLEVSKVTIRTIEFSGENKLDVNSSNFLLQPFDEIYVRKIPEYSIQNKITINGEINYPGTYVLQNKNEKLLDVIKRAGGLTSIAFINGVKLERAEYNLGYVIVNLKDAIADPKSQFNYILKENDIITIPKINELVSIAGAIQFSGIDTIGKINLPYIDNKRAGYYINNYAGGFIKRSLRNRVSVTEGNGRVRRTIRPLYLFRIYPKVSMGSKIFVPAKPVKVHKNNESTVDWNRAIEGTVVKLTGVLTLLVLVANYSRLTKTL
jgi:protein involved in polysaccharide export with SLBB domain